jgi:methylenetetrahydrofolate reductase (NADPH)
MDAPLPARPPASRGRPAFDGPPDANGTADTVRGRPAVGGASDGAGAAPDTIAARLAAGGRRLISFEFFPPADAAGAEQLWETIAWLRPLAPDFVSVTYGANGSTRGRTLDLTARLAQETSLTTMGHLTCASQSQAELEAVVRRYAAAGLKHVLAVRGDMPGGPTVPWRPHPAGLANATELVRLVKAQGDFCVGVAAFCDPHPQRLDPALDARLLLDKQAAGAEFAITQLFFRASSYFELVERVRRLGCTLPIVPGLMPITKLSQVERFAQLSGAALPRAITDRLDKLADDPTGLRQAGVQVVAELSQELIDGGAPGLHFFTQNRSKATAAILSALRQ